MDQQPKLLMRFNGLPDLKNMDEQGRRIVFRMGDLNARWILNEWTMEEYDRKNWRAAAMCHHAMLYLQDRLAYELSPPPTKLAIQLPAEAFDA